MWFLTFIFIHLWHAYINTEKHEYNEEIKAVALHLRLETFHVENVCSTPNPQNISLPIHALQDIGCLPYDRAAVGAAGHCQCPTIMERIVPHMNIPGKDQNSKL